MVQLLVGECLLLTVLKASDAIVIIILDMYVFKLPHEFWPQHMRMSILRITSLSVALTQKYCAIFLTLKPLLRHHLLIFASITHTI